MASRDAHRAPLFLSVLLASALAAGPVLAAGGVGDLYVTSDASNVVRAYTGATGSFIGIHTASVAPAAGELGVHFGLSNGRMLVGHFGGGVNEFDATTGAYIKTYNPGGGWMWAGIYRPNGNVYITDSANDRVVEYDGVTGAFIRVLATLPPNAMPSDLRYGPSGSLFVCCYGNGMVFELHPNTGAVLTAWNMPFPGDQPNDIAFLPSGDILVTVMGTNCVYRFDSTPAHIWLGSIFGTNWARPHGIDISPVNGHIFVADGVTTQVHEFDPVTFAELNTAYLSPGPGDKIVDLEFRRQSADPTPAQPSSWGRIKTLYR
jgi:DNA-binding beta-propeller fold protein YncE